MNELIAKVRELAAELVADAELQAEKGNKAAGTRARHARQRLDGSAGRGQPRDVAAIGGNVPEALDFRHRRVSARKSG